jgi:Raf kinase inhibitor-like YbhB/YbcL family protein
MKLNSNDLVDGQPCPAACAFAVPGEADPVALSDNRNPHLAWESAPEGTRSFAIVCHDPDVPSAGDDVNQVDREVPESLPRVDFYHWLLFDISVTTAEIAAGSHSDGITPRGKAGPDAGDGMRHGLNDYTGWFAGDADMEGQYYGYDGPCPPWNDSIIHHYVFTVYALDVEKLDVAGEPNGANVLAAMAGHVLDKADLTVTYTLNKRLLAR